MPPTLRKHLALALGVATLLATEVATAVAQPAGPSPAERLRQDTEAIHALGISGVQARVVAPDGRQSVATSGTADLNTGRPVSSDGYFRMASTSKTLVATVVLQLEVEGRLSLDDTVDHWLPGVVRGSGNDGSRITIRQLLQHTSGIHDDLPGYTTPEEYYQQRHDVHRPEQLVGRAMAHAPDFPPGEGWAYSNTGYVLLDMVIEKATGHPAHQEIEDRVLRPLGLDQTRWLGPRGRGRRLHHPQRRHRRRQAKRRGLHVRGTRRHPGAHPGPGERGQRPHRPRTVRRGPSRGRKLRHRLRPRQHRPGPARTRPCAHRNHRCREGKFGPCAMTRNLRMPRALFQTGYGRTRRRARSGPHTD
ncbi:serine hydrolase [Streptomyces sp. NEAU-YJ-81]|uniref:serine hydrolase domain-containing protein n=1 Tax=Streptomyces sp. NEAU-YJ-81 TaxID=2820288 RepID=UPI001ABC9EB5|nr:serine hydrolase domain-containing protein [Streptomyces sp. NEAU-YJ-81]MBO3676260.1 beta-lactamase family protein [Streptomyces sp. NEAU-YJ-81]